MKKAIAIVLLLVGAITLTSCTTDEAEVNVLEGLSERESIATMAYLSTGLLNFSEPIVADATSIMFLTDTEELEIDEEMDEVNQYMEQLRVFLDEGSNNFGNVVELESDDEAYGFMIEFTVRGELYVVYYNVDEVTGEYTGIIIIGDVTYELEVGLVEDVLDGKEPNDEQEGEELKTQLRLTARNGEDHVTIEYKKEMEEDETTLKFSMHEYKNNIARELEMKISHEENEMKIEVKENGNEFSFKKEVEDGEIVYKLKYKVGETEGEVKIQERLDENGEYKYQYQIKEQNKNKNVEMEKPDCEDDEDDEFEHDNDNEHNEENGYDNDNHNQSGQEEDESDSDEEAGATTV